VTVPAPGGNTDFVDGSRLLLGLALRTPVHEGLGYRGLRGERIFPDRIQGDAVFSACVVYGPGQDHELPSIARLQGVPPFHSRAGRSTSNRNPTCADWAERRFFKACGNLQWNNIIYRCGTCHQHKRRRARPAGACCSTVSFRPAIPWWVAPQQSPPPLHRPAIITLRSESAYRISRSLRLRADHASGQNLPTDSVDEAK